MQMFFFLVVTAVLVYAISTLLLPPQAEEEEEELWDASELRLESLLQGMMDPRLEIRERYSNRILAMGAGVIPRLCEALSQELFLEQNAMKIERLKEVILDFGLRSVPSLLHMLEEEGGDPAVTATVQEMLLDLGAPTLPQIVQRLGFPIVMPLIPVMQAWGLSSVKAALKGVRRRPKETFWTRLFLALGEEAIPLVEAAVEEWSGPAQETAFHILAGYAPSHARERFVASLDAPRESLRSSSVKALGFIADPEDLPLVEAALEDSALQVRLDAIEALAQFAPEDAVAPLLHFVERLEEEPARLEEVLCAALALARLGHVVDISHVERALGASVWRFRTIGLQLLQFLSTAEQVRYLERLLWDLDDRMVQESIMSLGALGTPDAATALLRYAVESHGSQATSQWIETALLSMTQEPTLLALADSLDDPTLRESGLALRVLLQTDYPAVLPAILLNLEQVEDPDAVWGVEPEDLHLYLQRIATRCELRNDLQGFLAQRAESPLAPAIRSFLSQLPPRQSLGPTPTLDPSAESNSNNS